MNLMERDSIVKPQPAAPLAEGGNPNEPSGMIYQPRPPIRDALALDIKETKQALTEKAQDIHGGVQEAIGFVRAHPKQTATATGIVIAGGLLSGETGVASAAEVAHSLQNSPAAHVQYYGEALPSQQPIHTPNGELVIGKTPATAAPQPKDYTKGPDGGPPNLDAAIAQIPTILRNEARKQQEQTVITPVVTYPVSRDAVTRLIANTQPETPQTQAASAEKTLALSSKGSLLTLSSEQDKQAILALIAGGDTGKDNPDLVAVVNGAWTNSEAVNTKYATPGSSVVEVTFFPSPDGTARAAVNIKFLKDITLPTKQKMYAGGYFSSNSIAMNFRTDVTIDETRFTHGIYNIPAQAIYPSLERMVKNGVNMTLPPQDSIVSAEVIALKGKDQYSVIQLAMQTPQGTRGIYLDVPDLENPQIDLAQVLPVTPVPDGLALAKRGEPAKGMEYWSARSQADLADIAKKATFRWKEAPTYKSLRLNRVDIEYTAADDSDKSFAFVTIYPILLEKPNIETIESVDISTGQPKNVDAYTVPILLMTSNNQYIVTNVILDVTSDLRFSRTIRPDGTAGGALSETSKFMSVNNAITNLKPGEQYGMTFRRPVKPINGQQLQQLFEDTKKVYESHGVHFKDEWVASFMDTLGLIQAYQSNTSRLPIQSQYVGKNIQPLPITLQTPLIGPIGPVENLIYGHEDNATTTSSKTHSDQPMFAKKVPNLSDAREMFYPVSHSPKDAPKKLGI